MPLLLLLLALSAAADPPCHKWEFTCRNGRCVPQTKVCDSINNCGDLSDEPRHCSPCNRTYLGAVGVTLDLEIHRPREEGLPFLCPLTIAAAGGDLGDIVQVSFDSFTVGRFLGSEGGCPDGGLQIREKGRPRIGGWFCGSAWGSGGSVSGAANPATASDRVTGSVDGSGVVSGAVSAGSGPGRPPVFFSESDAVTLVLSLLPMSVQASPAPPLARRNLHTSYDFDFRISFKMLSKEAAVVRYGGAIPGYSGGGFGNYHTIQSVNGGDSSLEEDDFPQLVHKNKWRTKTSGVPVLLPPLLYPLPPPAPSLPSPAPALHLGDLIPGTFCSRLFGGCDRRVCALQSPNYPGLYPRNLTCYFAVRQHRAPKGQVALIAVAQKRGHLVPIPTAAKGAEHQSECDDLHDYVTVYDGYTTRDPVLLRYCGGTSSTYAATPTAVSSGPELLVEFTSAPFGTLQPHNTASSAAATTSNNGPQPPNVSPLAPAVRGFQLQIEVRFVDQDSFLYTHNKKCEFWIRPPRRSSDTSFTFSQLRGMLRNPAHSLTSNSTCVYHLVGEEEEGDESWDDEWRGRRTKPNYRIWLSVLKFHVRQEPTADSDDCSSSLLLWDGAIGSENKGQHWDSNCPHGFCGIHRNATITPLLAKYCPVAVASSTSPPSSPSPPSCEHTLLSNHSRQVRPCTTSARLASFQSKLVQKKQGTVGEPPVTTPKEGFISSTPLMDIQMMAAESTSLRPVSFAALYEFVDLSQDGEALGEEACSRRFSSRPPASLPTVPSSPQRFTAPRNVFLYGRGGSTNLRFEVQEGERVRITVVRLLTANSSCRTSLEPIGPFHRCFDSSLPPFVRLQLSDLPWHDMPLTRHCFCSSPTEAPDTNDTQLFSFTSPPSRAVEVRFSAFGMGPLHDPDNIFFEADVEFMRVEEFFPTRQEQGKGKVAPMGKARQKKCESVSRRRLSGASGELLIKIPAVSEEHVLHCASQPYVIIPSAGRFLYVRTRGFHLMQPEGIVSLPGRVNDSFKATAPPCPTRNRLSVYSGDSKGAKLKAIICPLPPTSYSVDPRQRVELFSEGWEESSRGPPPQPSSFLPPPLPEAIESLFERSTGTEISGAVVIEPMAEEEGTYSISWLEVVPRRIHRPLIPPPGYPIPFLQETVDASFLPSGECIHRCPELGACINASLWCDGRPHCPSGFDESLCEHMTTASQHPLPLLYASLAFFLLLLLLLIALALHLRSRPSHTRPSCLPNGTSKSPSCAALDAKGS